MDAETDIVAALVERIRAIDKPVAQMAREADVPESWLKMFRRGKIPNPGVRPFERVRQYLERVA
jgi:hypothetical protein